MPFVQKKQRYWYQLTSSVGFRLGVAVVELLGTEWTEGVKHTPAHTHTNFPFVWTHSFTHWFTCRVKFADPVICVGFGTKHMVCWVSKLGLCFLGMRGGTQALTWSVIYVDL